MGRAKWHLKRSETELVLARHWPPRFDVQATAQFPIVRRGRLAHQIRQDMWREFQGLRGFSPVIQILSQANRLDVTAGARVDTRTFPRQSIADGIAALLTSPEHRTRWINWAQERAS